MTTNETSVRRVWREQLEALFAGVDAETRDAAIAAAYSVPYDEDTDAFGSSVVAAITPIVEPFLDAQAAQTAELRRSTDAGEAWQRAVEQFGTPQSIN